MVYRRCALLRIKLEVQTSFNLVEEFLADSVTVVKPADTVEIAKSLEYIIQH